MSNRYLRIGGLVAMGFDPSGRYLLAVSHNGRGVFDATTWERVARDTEMAYPEDGIAVGIGPIDGQRIAVVEIDYETGQLRMTDPNGRIGLFYQEGIVTLTAISC